MRDRWMVLTVSVVVALVGCGDSVKIIECPPGTRPDGAECVPLETTAPDATTTSDGDTSTTTDTATPTDTGAPPDTAGDTGGATDTAPLVDATPQPVGSACVRNADCADGTCLDWRGGYCTRLGCRDAGCPGGSTCVVLEGGNEACLAECDDACSGVQACKRLDSGLDAGLVDVCVAVADDAGDTGAPCVDATRCAGRAACLRAFPGGYCGALGCDTMGCPAGAQCVRLDGRATCLRGCTGDADCASAPGAERKCGVVQAFAGGPTQACISGVSGRPLGDPCASDFECESGTCQILGEGRCSQSDAPCFLASAASDCGPGQFCSLSGARVGVCSRPCAVGGVACPGESFCVAEGTAPTPAWCRPACGSGLPACDAALGFACRLGVPITSGGQERYVCAFTRPRGFAATCQNAASCASGACLLAGAGGYCTTSCGDDGFCPFGGACVSGATDACYQACFAESDCPSGFSCDLPTGSARNVCVPD